jgi:hypothetical protein
MKKIFTIEKTRKRVIWSEQEDKTLISLVESQQRRSWLRISKLLGSKTAYQCYLRFRSINPKLKKGTWDRSEDKKILAAVELYGFRWNIIAAEAFTNRNAKQIRDRYINYLDPKIKKDKFTVEEDLLILELHGKYGNKWSYMRQFIPHRSSDMIKNRFNSSIRRNMKLFSVLNSLNSTKMVRILKRLLIYILYKKRF